MANECANQDVKNLLQKLTSERNDEQRVTAYCDEIDKITNNLADLDDKQQLDQLVCDVTESVDVISILTAHYLAKEHDSDSVIAHILDTPNDQAITKLLQHGILTQYGKNLRAMDTSLVYLAVTYSSAHVRNADKCNCKIIMSELPKILKVLKSSYSSEPTVIETCLTLLMTISKYPMEMESYLGCILEENMLGDLTSIVLACHDASLLISEDQVFDVIESQLLYLISLAAVIFPIRRDRTSESGVQLRLAVKLAIWPLLPMWQNRLCKLMETDGELEDNRLDRIDGATVGALDKIYQYEGDDMQRFDAIKSLIRDGWFITLMNLYKRCKYTKIKILLANFSELMFNHSPNSTVEEQCELIPHLISLIEYKDIPQGQLAFSSSSYMTITEVAIDFALNFKQRFDEDREQLIKSINESKVLDVIVEFVEFNFRDCRSVQKTIVWFSSYAKWAGPEGVPITLTSRIVAKIVEFIHSLTGEVCKKSSDKYKFTVELPQTLVSLIAYNVKSKSVIRGMNKEHGIVGIVLQFLAKNKDSRIQSEFIGHFLFQFHLLVGLSDNDFSNLVKNLSLIHECLKKLKRQLKGDAFKKYCLLVISGFPLHSKPDPTTFNPLQDIVIELIEQAQFTSKLPLNAINLLWALTRWESCDLLNGFLMNIVKTGDYKRKAKRLKALSKLEKDSIYTFLVNEAIKRVESDELPHSRDLKCFTSKLLEMTNSGLSDNELYILEDLISPLMWMTSRVEDKKVIKNVKSFIDILH